MIYATFLPKRLSQSGCVVAGTQLKAHREKLKGQKIKLAAKVEAAVQAVLDKTRVIELLTTTDATMVEIDRCTDRCIAGAHDQLDAIERCFDRPTILPLSDKQSARLADTMLVRSALLPSGTGFLKLVYSQQWVRMTAMVKAMGSDEVAAAIKRLGLTLEAERLRAWVDLYGARLGLTEAKESDAAAIGVEAWHEAYGELMVRVHADYDNPKDDEHTRIREALTSPYSAQADEERRAEHKVRVKRKSGEPTEG